MRATGVLPVALILGVVLAFGCARAVEGEASEAVSGLSMPDGGDAGDRSLADAAAAINGEGGKVDEAKAKAELQKRKISIATVTIKRRSSVSDQITGTTIDGTASGEVRILGPVKVKVEGTGEYNVGERLILEVDDTKVIIAGTPATVEAALDALRAACIARIKPQGFVGAPSADDSSCCEVLDSSGLEG